MDNGSFWIVCEDNVLKQNCHCDWRVTIVDCIESKTMLYIYIANAVWSFVLTIIGTLELLYIAYSILTYHIGCGILYHRIFNKKQQMFMTSPYGFFIRPKPIESMLFFGIVFCIRMYLHATNCRFDS
jgi:hypothetical protein